MRVKKYLALIFAAILATTMLTACPWEEEEDKTDDVSSSTTSGSHPAGEDGDSNPDGGKEEDEEEETEAEPQDYTFTVAVEADGQEAPTRCYMQVVGEEEVKTGTISDNECSFTVSLKPSQEYTYLFWADHADSAEEPESLTSVPYQPGTAAYAAKESGKPNNQSITLRPVTTKVTLTDSSNTLESITNEETLTVALQPAGTYNVETSAATDSQTYTITHTFGQSVSTDSAVFKLLNTLSRGNDKEICSFYTLVSTTPGSSNEATITFRGLKMTTPLTVDQSETTALDIDLSQESADWKATAAYAEKRFDYFFKKSDGSLEGTPQNGDYYFYLADGKIDDLKAVVGDIFHEENVKFNLEGLLAFDKTLDGIYNFSITKISSVNSIYFYVFENDQLVCRIAYGGSNPNYTDFSAVSNKLKQTT